MTVASTAVVVNGPYVPNGLTTDFPFTFAVVASTDLSVDLDGSTLSPNLYTVTVNEGGGGTVHMLSAPVGSELFVYLNPDFGQQANFESGGPFLASVVEESYDKGVLRDQYLRGQIEQTIRVPLGDTPPTYAELLDMLAGSTGAPGGNVMSIGTFIGASGMGIGAGTDLVQTTGYSTAGSGAALYVYDAAVDAAYVAAHPRAAFIAAGGRGFRLDERQVLNVMMFGAVANDPGVGAFGTDDYPAFAAGFDYCQHRAIAGYINGTIYRGGLAFRIPKGGYYSSGSLVPLFSGKLFGDGGKGWGAATRIRFAAGVDGIQLQAHNTSGKTTLDGVTHFAGDRLHIADIAFIGAYTGTESDTHGCRAKRAATLERCTFDNFEGDGLYTNVTFNSGVGSTEGNTNAMRVIDCEFTNNRRGRYMEGSDANAITIIGCSYINNRQWGIDEESFLGNHEFGPHVDGNARTANNTGTAAKPASYSFSSGHVYFVINGQEAGAATNAPSGTTADNTWWGYAWDQGAASPDNGVVAWAGGKTWRAGGPIMQDGASNSSTFFGVHIEGNGISQLDQGGFIQGTTYQVVRVAGGALARNRAQTLRATTNGMEVGGNFIVQGDTQLRSPSNIFGPVYGATVADGAHVLASRNTAYTITYSMYDAVGNITSSPLVVAFGAAFGRTTDFTSGAHFERWKFAGTEVAQLNATGLVLGAGLGLYVGANKVVGTRGAAVADATDAASAITQLNALLARVRAHGLIA